MPVPILQRVSRHFSAALHHLVYSFPSPNITDPTLSAESPLPGESLPSGGVGGVERGLDAKMMDLGDPLGEPGEGRAFAGGIGPLSFAGSGYGVTLVLMAILLNRIHHIVRRPRRPPPPQPHPPIPSFYWRTRRMISRALTSSSAPKYLRLPGLICLFRAWFLFSILLLQVANLWPVDSPRLNSTSYGRAITQFGRWAGSMTMAKVCWQVFMSVCIGLVCAGVANGLDRAANHSRRAHAGAGFNLVGLITDELFRLSQKATRTFMPLNSGNQTRPDIHALFQLWLSLTELTWLQAIELSPRLRKNQLLPTAVCGSMGLAHFVYALFTSPLKFPSFTFLTHLMALFLSVVIVFSVVVKAITHMFTLGYLPSPILVNLLPHEGAVPVKEDDFGVALLKLGTACIESTQFSGLRNELIAIEEKNGPWVELSANQSVVIKPKPKGLAGFGAEITDVEVSELIDPRMESGYWKTWRGFWGAFLKSILIFVWTAIIATPAGRKCVDLCELAWRQRWWYGPRSWRFWRRQAWRAPTERRRAERLKLYSERYRARIVELRAARAGDQSTATSSAVQLRETTPAPLPWKEYLKGETEVEDDEEDWEDHETTTSSSSSAISEDDDRDLYRDLVSPPDQEPEEDIQPILLAHLTNSSTPLTRRRYQAILTSPSRTPTPGGMSDIIQERRAGLVTKQPDEWDEERRRSCVVCTIEPRDTILWPCRCLALCNDCRESLASRLPAKDHLCPCCRKKVEGYSRIFVP